MLNDDGVGLFSSSSLMSDSVERSFDLVYGHSDFFTMVDTHPPEAYSFELPLKLGVDADSLSVLEMHQRNSKFGAIIVLPKVLA
jgi:hypothetical protein